MRRLSRFESLALIGLAVWGFAPLVLMLVHAARTGDVFTGADGEFAADQLQYLSWVREAGTHLLAANDFMIAPRHAVYLNPMFVISGALWRLGAGLAVSLQVWKPVAILMLFAGVVLYARRLVPHPGARAAVITIAVFFAAPTAPLFRWAHLGGVGLRNNVLTASGELFPAAQLWGYAPAVIAVGLMPLFVLGVERILVIARETSPRFWHSSVIWTALAGGLASWLHPWQGETLALIGIAICLWLRFDGCSRLLPVLAVTVAPLVYYAALSHYDMAWGIARAQDLAPALPLGALILALAPLALVAAIGVSRPSDAGERLLLLWVPAELLVYAALSPSGAAHALTGLSIPLAVLAVRGWSRLRTPRALAVLAVAVLVVPGMALAANLERDYVDGRAQPTYLRPGEAAALAYLDADHNPGGVLTTGYLGSAIPAFTGREVWDGHPAWTLDWLARVRLAGTLFDGQLRGARARALISGAGVRFLVADCSTKVDLLRTVGSEMIAGERRFGCATVYTLRGRPSSEQQ